MTVKKRDQRQYDLIQQYLSGLILNTVLGIIKEPGDPYTVKPGLGGMTAYSPSAMASVCIMLEAQRTTYRKMVGVLRSNNAMAARMGLGRIPSKSTIARAYGMIPEWYLAEVHRIVIKAANTDSLAADSTGYSYLRFVRWFNVRTDSFRIRKGWVELHAIVDIRTRTIIGCMVTGSAVADINGLYAMLGRLGRGTGDFCLDSAYLARLMCGMMSAIGMTPLIKPKSNTVRNAKGSRSWREMVSMYVDDRDRFDSQYHQRSIIEAVFAALKKMYGDSTRCRRYENRVKEIAIRVMCYNTELVARQQTKDGRLTQDQIAILAA